MGRKRAFHDFSTANTYMPGKRNHSTPTLVTNNSFLKRLEKGGTDFTIRRK